MSKITDYYNLPIGSTAEEIDKECKDGKPVTSYGEILYTVKNTYKITSSCVDGKYLMQDLEGNTKEVSVEELMSENYLVEPLKVGSEIEKERWESLYYLKY